MSFIGLLVILFLALLMSENRRAIQLKTVLPVFILQIAIAAFFLHVPLGHIFLNVLVTGIQSIINYSQVGIEFLFGDIGKKKMGFIFAFHVLPIIVFFSALMSTLYHLGIMQKFATVLGYILNKLFKIDKTESMCAVANIFVGQSQAPLVIKPYLKPYFFSTFCHYNDRNGKHLQLPQ